MNTRLPLLFQILGPVLSLIIYGILSANDSFSPEAAATAGITFLCAFWWCTEAIPIPVTSLIPFVLFPMTDIVGYKVLAGNFGHKFILLFMGGFMLSRAAEKSKTHLRIAHLMVKGIGTETNSKLIIGFMLATAFCSMWISNTATALIMLPVAIAVIKENHNEPKFSTNLLLAIAYGASIGGIATLIGTPPNGAFASAYSDIAGEAVDFVSWFKIGLPVSILMLIVCGFILTRGVSGNSSYEAEELGPWTPWQKRVLVIMSLTALLWVTRKLPFGLGGWSVWLNMPKAEDATVALLAVICMFLIPNGEKNKNGTSKKLLDWESAVQIPWGILLLFAGGLAIASAFNASGLAGMIGNQLQSSTAGMHPLLIIVLISFSVTFLTEITSNTATATLLMPILAAGAISSGLNPTLYMIPAALSASCAFMLPIATPPNAIVFGGAEWVTIPKMVRTGLWLNLAGVVIISLVCYFLLDPQTGL
ncbi:SLC13 family permease [Kiritimatiellaeota bacterium B1221]|nr:SLC13 family permease [Kiritimatiellaeota bacterium B1221]